MAAEFITNAYRAFRSRPEMRYKNYRRPPEDFDVSGYGESLGHEAAMPPPQRREDDSWASESRRGRGESLDLPPPSSDRVTDLSSERRTGPSRRPRK